MFAEHDLSVLEFQRVGVARFGDGMDFCAFGKLVEDRMQRSDNQECQDK